METATLDVLNVIKYYDLDDLVLVGHSFAGKVAAAVADRETKKVRLLLYVDAFRPDKVRTPQGSFDPAAEYGPPPPGSNSIPLTERIIDSIGREVNGPEREWMLSKATPWPIKLAADPITLSENLDSVKSAYIFCSQSGDPVDDIIAGKWGKLEGPYTLIDSGHWPMITKPKELVDDMLSLAGISPS
jgi:pimeloyl-ACP methyl ester carboxylesterase